MHWTICFTITADNNNWDLSFEIMDKIIDNVKTIALRRF